MNDLSANWDEIRRLLLEAGQTVAPDRKRESAPAPVGLLSGTWEEFDEFLEHNELELAWDALAAIAERANAPKACWRQMAKAANLMHLPAKERRAEGRAASGEK